jgi:hypothetical protein
MHDLGSAHPATRPAPDRHPWLHARTDPENGDRSSRNRTAPPETGRSPTQTQSGRCPGPPCPPVLTLGEAWRCEPLVSNLGNRSRYAPPISPPKPRMKGYQPTVSTVGSPTPNRPPTESAAARPEGRRPLASRSPVLQHGDSVPPRLQLWKTHAPSQGAATPKTPFGRIERRPCLSGESETHRFPSPHRSPYRSRKSLPPTHFDSHRRPCAKVPPKSRFSRRSLIYD